MKGSDLIDGLNIRSTNPGVRFDEIVRKIFSQIAKDENVQILFQVKYKEYQFDIALPQGINEYKKQTFVEIKYFQEKNLRDIQLFIDKYIGTYKSQFFYNGNNNIDLNYILFVLPFHLTEREKQTIINRFKLYVNRFEIIVWGIEDLQPYFERYAEYIIHLIPELKERAFKNIIEKSAEKSRDENEEILNNPDFHINKIKQAYKSDDLVLFLGAGVSVSAGLPTWDGLLSKLLLAIIEKNLNDNNLNDEQKERLTENLKKINDSSPLQVARYVNSGLSEDFEKQVSSLLYKTLKESSKVELLQSIGKLCIPPRAGNGIKAITNYNFDDVMEHVLDSFDIKNKPIYNDNTFPSSDEIGIFHVHGFLPRNPENFDGLRDSLLIFSEKNYHTIMSDAYNWSNLTQLNFFRENTCLFIGQSGTDPNLRRLLEIAKQRTKVSKHYIILKRTEKEKFLKDFTDNIPKETTLNTIIEVHHKLQELSFDEIGLNVLWVNDFDEIVTIINKIKN